MIDDIYFFHNPYEDGNVVCAVTDFLKHIGVEDTDEIRQQIICEYAYG